MDKKRIISWGKGLQSTTIYIYRDASYNPMPLRDADLELDAEKERKQHSQGLLFLPCGEGVCDV